MVVLKKIKASTLMETLVATVLIVIVFMLSSMILNNLFSNSINSNTRAIETHLSELQYLYINEKLILPYQGNYKTWKVSIESFEENGLKNVLFEATDPNTNKTLERVVNETN